MRRCRTLAAYVFASLLASLFALAWVAAAAVPAGAQTGGITSSDRRISISGDVEVARGEVVSGPVAAVDGSVFVRGKVTDYVVVGDGNLIVSGRVTRGVVVVHGNAVISGHVGGDVVALTGRVTVTRTGSVGGDVVSRRDPHIAPGTVDGEVRSVDLRGIFTGVIIGFLAYLWLAVTISTALLGLAFVALLPRAADTAAAAGRRVGASFGWGVLIGVAGPLIAVLILATVLGLPLGFTMLSGLNVLAPLGYVAAALVIGRLWVKGRTPRARIGAFFAGFGILRLVALIPGLGLLVWFVVCIYGIGAVSMAAWYGGHDPRPREDSAPDSAESDGASVERGPEPATEPVPVATGAVSPTETSSQTPTPTDAPTAAPSQTPTGSTTSPAARADSAESSADSSLRRDEEGRGEDLADGPAEGLAPGPADDPAQSPGDEPQPGPS